MVSHFTYGWTQDCVNSLRIHCPEFPLLIVDNNPSKNDNEDRAKSYTKTWHKKNYAERCEMSDIESKWIRSQKEITVLDTDHYMNHAESINMANQWAHKRGIEILVSIDPDCVAQGSEWVKSFVAAINNGYWLVSGDMWPSGIARLIPCAWNVKESLGFGFDTCSWKKDSNSKFYKEIVKPKYIIDWQERLGNWDFGQKYFFECAKIGKFVYVPIWDFKHFNRGSRGHYHPLQKRFINSYNTS